jgi:regulator of sigma E protease
MANLLHPFVGSMANLFTSVGAFLIVLTIVVTIHELGHFFVARSFGVAVDRFAIGFGRPLWHRTDRHGIEWRIGWLPLGGYVRFAGDNDASSSVPDAEDLDDLRTQIIRKQGAEAVDRYFHFKPIWQRALVVAAGPAANFVLSILLFAIFASVVGVNTIAPRVGMVLAGSPAARSGIAAGDLITAVDRRPVTDFKQIVEYVHLRAGEPMTVAFLRNGTEHMVTLTPRRVTQRDELTGRTMQVGLIGMAPSRLREDYLQTRLGPVAAVAWGAHETWDIVATTVTYLSRIVTGKEPPTQLSSFLGMAQTAGAVAKAGAESAPDLLGKAGGVAINLLSFAALVSTAVGFMNLLPVPVLDGGHLLFYGYEALARRPVGAKVQAASYRIGLALLLGLMLFATWNDLQQRSVFNLLGFTS